TLHPPRSPAAAPLLPTNRFPTPPPPPDKTGLLSPVPCSLSPLSCLAPPPPAPVRPGKPPARHSEPMFPPHFRVPQPNTRRVSPAAILPPAKAHPELAIRSKSAAHLPAAGSFPAVPPRGEGWKPKFR